MRWLAVDPGKTVGWATGWREPGGTLHLHGHGQAPHTKVEAALRSAIAEAEAEAVVMETFVMLDNRLREGAVITPKVINRLTAFFSELELPLYQQQASAAKGVMTDKRLKLMGLWIKGQPHARDAIRHLVIATRRAASGSTTFRPVDG